MFKQKVSLVILLAVLLILTSFPQAYSEGQSEVEKGVGYLKSQPQTAWSSMALAAAGEANIDLAHLQSVPSSQKSATTYAKNILALVANGKNPTSFGNENYVEQLKSYYLGSQFGDKALLNDDVWAIIALGAIGQENTSQALAAKDYLLTYQNQDGGWGYSTSSDSDPNSTASVIIALLEAGVSAENSAITNAVNYLKSKQNSDGGFPYVAGEQSDSCSDAWVISAISKLGENATSSSWTKNNNNPLSHLKSLQDEDGGFWWQQANDNKFCSPYAVLALLDKSYPVETPFNTHKIRIEGETATICSTGVSGGTVMDLVIAASKPCSYTYTIVEYPGMGLYLSELGGETSWMYMVGNVSPLIGAGSYYLEMEDEALWYSGEWLDNGWHPTKVEITKTETQAVLQAQTYNQDSSAWELLEQQTKIQVGEEEMVSESNGSLTLNFAAFSDGVYPLYVKRQIISDVGYIRSAKENLTIGTAPQEHQVGLRVEIEAIEAPSEGRQESISFTLSPNLLDFGKIKAGESSVKSLTLTNGDSAIYLESEVTGDGIFRDNLKIDNTAWRDFSTMLEQNQQKVFGVGLHVPSDYSGDLGLKEGTLTFWAITQ